MTGRGRIGWDVHFEKSFMAVQDNGATGTVRVLRSRNVGNFTHTNSVRYVHTIQGLQVRASTVRSIE